MGLAARVRVISTHHSTSTTVIRSFPLLLVVPVLLRSSRPHPRARPLPCPSYRLTALPPPPAAAFLFLIGLSSSSSLYSSSQSEGAVLFLRWPLALLSAATALPLPLPPNTAFPMPLPPLTSPSTSAAPTLRVTGGFLSFLGGISYQIRILLYRDVSCMYLVCILMCPVRIHQDTSRYIKIHQDTSRYICIYLFGYHGNVSYLGVFTIHLGYI